MGKKYILMNFRLKKIAGDASFREFYRVKKNNKSSIIVLAKKDQFKNLIVYSLVNNILNINKVSSPKLIKSYYKDNMIEITDLGEKSFYDYIKKKRNKKKDYKKLIELILKLQKIKLRKTYFFLGKKLSFQNIQLTIYIKNLTYFLIGI